MDGLAQRQDRAALDAPAQEKDGGAGGARPDNGAGNIAHGFGAEQREQENDQKSDEDGGREGELGGAPAQAGERFLVPMAARAARHEEHGKRPHQLNPQPDSRNPAAWCIIRLTYGKDADRRPIA